MTRGKYVFEGGTFIPKVDKPTAAPTSAMVIMDEIPATQHPANRQFYTSRTQFDAVTKAYGYENVTDADLDRMKEEVSRDDDIIEDILKAEQLLNYGEGLPYEERDLCRIQEERAEWKTNN